MLEKQRQKKKDVRPLSSHVNQEQTSSDFPRRGIVKESWPFIELEATKKQTADKGSICVAWMINLEHSVRRGGTRGPVVARLV